MEDINGYDLHSLCDIVCRQLIDIDKCILGYRTDYYKHEKNHSINNIRIVKVFE